MTLFDHVLLWVGRFFVASTVVLMWWGLVRAALFCVRLLRSGEEVELSKMSAKAIRR